MNHPTTQIRDFSSTTRARAVEEHLTRLQDSHRLAIHMVEENCVYYTPYDKTLEAISTLQPGDIAPRLRNHRPSWMSFSLIPSTQTGISMVPYNVEHAVMNNFGYLFDFSQNTDQEKTPGARVGRVSPDNLTSSASDDADKSLCLSMFATIKNAPSTIHERLKELYYRIGNFIAPPECSKDERGFNRTIIQWERNLMDAIGGERGAEFTEQQLNFLGNLYRDSPQYFVDYHGDHKDSIARHNEVIASVSLEHMAAIVVPLFCKDSNRPHDYYDARAHLQAALVGLHHLNLKPRIDKPVMIYDIDAPKVGKQQLHYVGQGEHELQTAALKALVHLGQHYPESMKLPEQTTQLNRIAHNDLTHSLQMLLHINLSEEPGAWLHDAQAKLTDLTKAAPAPSQPLHRTSPESGGR